MFNFLPLVMNALQGQKAQKENANQNEARAYMGQAPVEGARFDLLQGVIGGGGHKEPDGDEDAMGNEPPGPEESSPLPTGGNFGSSQWTQGLNMTGDDDERL